MFRQVFNPDNLLWRIIASGVDFVGLGLFWALLSLPVITVAPATAALYYAVVKVFRQREEDGFTLMWRSFRSCLRRGIVISLICIPVLILICYGYSVLLANSGNDVGAVMFVAYYLALVIPVGTILYLLPSLGRFDLPIPAMIRNCIFLAFRHLPFTVILVMLDVQIVIATIENPAWIFLSPVGACLLSSVFTEQVFEKYLSVEERARLKNRSVEELEEEEKRRNRKKK